MYRVHRESMKQREHTVAVAHGRAQVRDEGDAEKPAFGGDGGAGGETNIARTHAQCVPRSLEPAAGEAGLSRPRHSVRDTIRCNLRAGLGTDRGGRSREREQAAG